MHSASELPSLLVSRDNGGVEYHITKRRVLKYCGPWAKFVQPQNNNNNNDLTLLSPSVFQRKYKVKQP